MVLGASTARYRRSIALFDRYIVRARVSEIVIILAIVTLQAVIKYSGMISAGMSIVSRQRKVNYQSLRLSYCGSNGIWHCW